MGMKSWRNRTSPLHRSNPLKQITSSISYTIHIHCIPYFANPLIAFPPKMIPESIRKAIYWKVVFLLISNRFWSTVPLIEYQEYPKEKDSVQTPNPSFRPVYIVNEIGNQSNWFLFELWEKKSPICFKQTFKICTKSLYPLHNKRE